MNDWQLSSDHRNIITISFFAAAVSTHAPDWSDTH